MKLRSSSRIFMSLLISGRCGRSTLALASSVLLGCAMLLAQASNIAAQAADSNAGATTNAAAGQVAVEAADATTNEAPAEPERDVDAFRRRFAENREKGGINRSAIVVIGKDVVLKAGESAE